MSFVDELHKLENVQNQQKKQDEMLHDEKLLNQIIEGVLSLCKSRVSAHSLNGFLFFHDNELRVQNCAKSQILKSYDMSRNGGLTGNNDGHFDFNTQRSGDFSIDKPDIFLKIYKERISRLGFDSSKCELIPIQRKRLVGKKTNFLGTFKVYGDYAVGYCIWIDFSL